MRKIDGVSLFDKQNIMKRAISAGFFLTVLLFARMTPAQQIPHSLFNLRVDYKMTYNSDSNDLLKVSEEYMELLINKDITVFQSQKESRIDSAYYANKSGGAMAPAGFYVSNFTKVRYQIVKMQDSIITRDEYEMRPNVNYHYYLEYKNDFNWIIKNDTITIGGMLCQLAEVDFGGRRWKAWFTTEIPVSDGPYKFCGLPGLILSMIDTTGHWRFDFVKFSHINRQVVVKYDIETPTSFTHKEAYFKSARHYKQNMSAIEEARGLISFPDAESRRAAKKRDRERLKKDNNWIELYMGD